MGKVGRVGKEVEYESGQSEKNENENRSKSCGSVKARGQCRAQGNLSLGLNGRMKRGNSGVPVPTFLTKNANGRIWKASTALAVSSQSRPGRRLRQWVALLQPPALPLSPAGPLVASHLLFTDPRAPGSI